MMAECFKEFEEEIIASVSSDPLIFAKDLVQNELIVQADLDLSKLSHREPDSQQIRYLMELTYNRLLATSAMDRFLEVLMKSGVDNDLLEKIRTLLGSLSAENSLPGIKRCHSNALLKEEHVPALADILAPYSSKWQMICTALFLPHNLIETFLPILLSTGAEMCLVKVLHEWVSQNHENAMLPTVGNLKKALCGNLVKLGKVAAKLDKTLADHGIDLANEETGLPAKRPCITLDNSASVDIQHIDVQLPGKRPCTVPEHPASVDIAQFSGVQLPVSRPCTGPANPALGYTAHDVQPPVRGPSIGPENPATGYTAQFSNVQLPVRQPCIGPENPVSVHAAQFSNVQLPVRQPCIGPENPVSVHAAQFSDVQDVQLLARQPCIGPAPEQFSDVQLLSRQSCTGPENPASVNFAQFRNVQLPVRRPWLGPENSASVYTTRFGDVHVPANRPPRNFSSVEGTLLFNTQSHLMDQCSSETVWLSECRKVLTDVYLTKPEVPEDSWPPRSNEVFINLALIKNNNISDSEYCRCTIQGDMDDIFKDKESIDYHSMLQDLEKGARLLIEGRPGSGKTTLVHKISQDWANGLCLANIKLLFLIHLRHFFSNPDVTIHDLIKYHYTIMSSVEQIAVYAQRESGDGLCFILDGLDEYTPPKSKLLTSTVLKLIRKEIMPNAVVIVASRPSGSAKIRNVATKQVETLGFLKDEIKQYINNYKFSTPEKVEGLHAYLKDHSNVMHMCYLPIHSAMVCYLYDRMGSSLPKTETAMYTKFTLYTLLRLLHRVESDDTDIYLTSVDDLPEREKKVFDEISQLAFEKTKEFLQVVRRSEIKHFFNSVNSDKDSLGLITVDRVARIDGEESLYTFLHLTFQEYLAAYYIKQLERDEQNRYIKKYGKKKKMQVVWKFYCGLMNFEGNLEQFTSLMKCSNDDHYRVQCAFESQQPITCTSLVNSGAHRLLFVGKFLNPSDFTALGYVMSNVAHPVEELEISTCTFGEDGVKTFLKEVGTAIHSVKCIRFHGGSSCSGHQLEVLSMLLDHMTSLEVLDVIDTSIGVKKIKVLTDLKFPNLSTLKLDNSQCDAKFLKLFSSMVKHSHRFECLENSSLAYNPNLRASVCDNFGSQILCNSIVNLNISIISLIGCKLNCDNLVKLSDSILSHAWYTQLNLTGCNIGDEEVKVIISAISKLKTLILKLNHMGNRGAMILAQGLRHCNNLRLLDVSCNEIGDEGAHAIVDATCHLLYFKCYLWNHNLSEYSTKDGKEPKDCKNRLFCGGVEVMSNETLPLLMRILESSNDFDSLLSFSFKIDESTASHLSDCLKHCKMIQVLDFEGSKIGCEGAKCLAAGLKHCIHLQSLNLCSNAITCEGGIAIFNSLKHCNQLLNLNLADNYMKSEGAIALSNCLNFFKSIQVLNLSKNCIDDDGITALAARVEICQDLHSFYFDENQLNNKGIKALIESLKHCNNLYLLSLDLNKITKDSANLFGEGLRYCKSLHTLRLSNNFIGSDGMKAIAKGLTHCSSLRALYLDQNEIDGDSINILTLVEYNSLQILHMNNNKIGSDGAEMLSIVLKCCSNLHTFSLNSNRIGSSGARALVESLKDCSNLHTLRLGSNDINNDGIKAFAEYMKHFSNLHTLDLGSNIIGSYGARALAECLKHCSNLHTLNLGSNEIGSDGTKVIAESLKHFSNLHTLNLGSNEIGNDGAKALAEGLKHCSYLHTLNLGSNKIDSDGTEVLAESLKHFSNLHTLDLGSNEIGNNGAKALAEGLKCCSNLHVLNLNSNIIDSYGVRALAKSLKHFSNLHTLDLNSNMIGSGGARALAEGLKHCSYLHTLNLNSSKICTDRPHASYMRGMFRLLIDGICQNIDGIKAIAEGLKHLSNLHTLKLHDNRLGNNGVKILAEGLKHCSNLHTLHLGSNYIRNDGAKALAENLKHSSNLHTLNLSSNKISGDDARAISESLEQCILSF